MPRSSRRVRSWKGTRARTRVRSTTRARRSGACGEARLSTHGAVLILVAGGIGLSACGSSSSLSLHASEQLAPTISGAPGSSSWCTGVKKSADSLIDLGRGESDGIAARIVRNDEQRVTSAVRRLPPHSAAAAKLEASLRTMRSAVSDLEDGRNAGFVAANSASAQIKRALTRLGGAAGASC